MGGNVVGRASQRRHFLVRGSRRCVALLLAANIAVLVPNVAAAAPAPVNCGSTIAINTTLGADLFCGGSDGLILGQGVILNLGGHRLIGSGSGTGITLSPEGESAVTNGTIQDFTVGVLHEGLSTPTSSRLQRLTLTNAGVNISSGASLRATGVTASNSPIGIYAADLTITDSHLTNAPVQALFGAFTIERSTVVGAGVATLGSGSATIDRSRMDGRGRGRLADCSETSVTITNSKLTNYATGIGGYYCGATLTHNWFSKFKGGVLSDISQGFVQDGTPYTFITGNVFTDSGTALKSGAMVVRNNAFIKNTNGVVFLQPQWSRATGNIFYKNTGSGIVADEGGLTVAKTRAIENGRYGIYAPGAVDLGGNVAFGNGVAQCLGLVCAGR